jgi:membrane protein
VLSSTKDLRIRLNTLFARPIREAKIFGQRFKSSEIPLRASALAYHTILAIVPVIGLVFLYLKKIGITRKWHQKAQEFVISHLNVSSSDDFLKTFTKLTTSVSGATAGWIGVGIIIYTAYSMMTRLGNSLDVIYNTSPAAPEFKIGFLKLLGRRFFVLLCLPVALLASLAAASWLRDDSILKYVFKLEIVGSWFALPLPVLIDTIAFALVYQFIPQRPISGKQALKAAFVTSTFFEIARFGVGEYNRHALMTQKIYGALSVIPVFIIWVQLAWIILLTGTLFIRIPQGQAQHYVAPDTTPDPNAKI